MPRTATTAKLAGDPAGHLLSPRTAAKLLPALPQTSQYLPK
ncbi:hypothetical protein LJR228_001023 [Mesorhizobium caraganae]